MDIEVIVSIGALLAISIGQWVDARVKSGKQEVRMDNVEKHQIEQKNEERRRRDEEKESRIRADMHYKADMDTVNSLFRIIQEDMHKVRSEIQVIKSK